MNIHHSVGGSSRLEVGNEQSSCSIIIVCTRQKACMAQSTAPLDQMNTHMVWFRAIASSRLAVAKHTTPYPGSGTG